MMLIYSHSTPEKLITRYYSVEQLRKYPVCEITPGVPDDLLTTTNYTIVEDENTLNIDHALAILYNNVTDVPSAFQFARFLTINGPRTDVKTILFYVDRINNGPYGNQVNNYVTKHFNYASKGKKIPTFNRSVQTNSDIYDYDQEFTNQLIDARQDCLYAPCNYFGYSGEYGLLANPEQIPTINSLPYSDYASEYGPPGTISQSIYKGVLPTIQANLLLANQALTTLTKNVKALFLTDEEKSQQFNDYKSGVSATTHGSSSAVAVGLSQPDFSTYFTFQKAKSQVMNRTTNSLGDCARINSFFRQYNPYDASQNLTNTNPYYNPYSKKYPLRTNESLSVGDIDVMNHNKRETEVNTVNADGVVVQVEHNTDGYYMFKGIDVKTTIYGYLIEFGSSKDDEYVGSPGGETSWDKAYGSLVDKHTWMGNTRSGEVNNLIPVPEERKQTISSGPIKIPSKSGIAAYTNYTRTANGVGEFRSSNCAVSPALSELLKQNGFNERENISILLEGGKKIDLLWVDVTAEGLGYRVDLFTPVYDPSIDNKKILGVKKLGVNNVGEVVKSKAPLYPEGSSEPPQDNFSLFPGSGAAYSDYEDPQGTIDQPQQDQ